MKFGKSISLALSIGGVFLNVSYGAEPSPYVEYDKAQQEQTTQLPPPSITFETAVARSKARRLAGRNADGAVVTVDSNNRGTNLGGINIPPGATLNAREIILMPRIGDVTVLPGPRRP